MIDLLTAAELTIPTWVQATVAAAALVTALGVLWQKVLRPGMRAAALAEEMLPLLTELTIAFRGSPGAFLVLEEVAAQFRTDSGSSLRDVVNRLEAAAQANATHGETLKVGVEASRLLAEQDRQQVARLMILVDRLTVKVDGGVASQSRQEATGNRMELAAAGVAADLEASHQRANDGQGPTGAAADAAAVTHPNPRSPAQPPTFR